MAPEFRQAAGVNLYQTSAGDAQLPTMKVTQDDVRSFAVNGVRRCGDICSVLLCGEPRLLLNMPST
jgi:hypothetical protein